MSSGTLAFITVRYESERLPHKALLDINGKTLLEHTLEGVAKAQLNYPPLVATTAQSLPIIDYCLEHGIWHVIADGEDDILSRIAKIIPLDGHIDHMVRVWGDNPLPFCWLINESVDYFKKHNYSYVVFHAGDSYSAVSNATTYRNLDKIVKNPKDRFDIHLWMMENLYTSIVNYPIPIKFTIDTPEELEQAKLWLK